MQIDDMPAEISVAELRRRLIEGGAMTEDGGPGTPRDIFDRVTGDDAPSMARIGQTALLMVKVNLLLHQGPPADATGPDWWRDVLDTMGLALATLMPFAVTEGLLSADTRSAGETKH